MDIQIKRIYETPSNEDGIRILVDRLWPRGYSKEKAGLDYWLKDFAPSHDLRKWFHQHLDKWDNFVKLYNSELLQNKHQIIDFFNDYSALRITLLYSSKLKDRNHAIILKQFTHTLFL